MRNPLIPTYVFDSIYQITPALLQKNQIKGVLIDLDGTMASRHAARPPETVRPFIQALQQAGIKVLVLSNNNEQRVRIFCEDLNAPYLHRAFKPSKAGFMRGAEQLGLPLSSCAVIGDQIYTDTFGGNRAGAAITCYVRSLDLSDALIHFRYLFERGFIAYGKRKMEEREQ